MTRTVTERETQLKAELQNLITSGAEADAIVLAAEAVANQILEAAEAEASMFGSRAGVPMSEEGKARLRAHWTPEKRAEQSARLKGRTLTEEQKLKLSNSLKQNKVQREAKEAAMIARIAELEALMAGNGITVEPTAEVTDEQPSGRGGRRRG